MGIDLVAINEVADAVARFGDRYLNRVYTPGEVAYCTGSGRSGRVAAAHLAARFAAKEATFKALRGGQGDGNDDAFDWQSIELHRLADGSCILRLQGEAQRIAARRGVGHLDVSFSHDGGYAIAVVVGEAAPTPSSASRFRRQPRRTQRQ